MSQVGKNTTIPTEPEVMVGMVGMVGINLVGYRSALQKPTASPSR
jgi:hypothetical protein